MPKKKGMNRTAGTARRKMSASERVSYGLKTGAPLTGSASGVKSISLRQAGEALTQGIVSARGKKLSFDPAGLAMALPVGKVAKAGQALKAAGKFGVANQFLGRVAAKKAGREFGKDLAIAATSKAAGGKAKTLREGSRIGGKIFKGRTSRMTSEIDAFPRLPKGNLPPGEKPTFDVLADPFGEGNWRSADRIQPVKNALKTGFAKFSKKVSGKEAKKAAEGTRVGLPAAASRAELRAMVKLGKMLARQDNPYRRDLK